MYRLLAKNTQSPLAMEAELNRQLGKHTPKH